MFISVWKLNEWSGMAVQPPVQLTCAWHVQGTPQTPSLLGLLARHDHTCTPDSLLVTTGADPPTQSNHCMLNRTSYTVQMTAGPGGGV